MAKKKYVASCPCCGKKLCLASNDSDIQILCTGCKALVDVIIEDGIVSVKQAELPVQIMEQKTVKLAQN